MAMSLILDHSVPHFNDENNQVQSKSPATFLERESPVM